MTLHAAVELCGVMWCYRRPTVINVNIFITEASRLVHRSLFRSYFHNCVVARELRRLYTYGHYTKSYDRLVFGRRLDVGKFWYQSCWLETGLTFRDSLLQWWLDVLEFCPTFEWCQMDLCWQDVVRWLVGHSCLGRSSDDDVASVVKLLKTRRDVYCRSTLQAWCCYCHWRFSGDAPQCTPYTSQISFRPQPNSDELRGGIKSSNYYTLMTNDFHQFKSPRFLSQASRWLVGLDDVIDSSGLWLLGRICR